MHPVKSDFLHFTLYPRVAPGQSCTVNITNGLTVPITPATWPEDGSRGEAQWPSGESATFVPATIPAGKVHIWWRDRNGVLRSDTLRLDTSAAVPSVAPRAPAAPRCECGAEVTYGAGPRSHLHSRWCPFYGDGK